MGRPTTLTYIVGARPNFVKMAPVISALRLHEPRCRHIIINTGQHYDHALADGFLRDLKIPTPDYSLGVGSASHALQTARALERVESVLIHDRPDVVIIPGDVNSTLAAALAAAKLALPVAHVESGLRSFDRRMPEEINRIVADTLAQYLFVHSEEGVTNLLAEGISEDRIHLVGNTMIDSLVALEPRFRERATAEQFGVRRGEYLLVTLHRPSLVDNPALNWRVLRELAAVARDLPVVFPMHPRTRKMLGSLPCQPGLHLTGPFSYLDFLSMQADAKAVLTDSGGIQEESTFLGVPCFTLRDNTERPVTVRMGTNTLLGLEPARIADILPALAAAPSGSHVVPPLWDGHAADRIAQVLEGSLKQAKCGY